VSGVRDAEPIVFIDQGGDKILKIGARRFAERIVEEAKEQLKKLRKSAASSPSPEWAAQVRPRQPWSLCRIAHIRSANFPWTSCAPPAIDGRPRLDRTAGIRCVRLAVVIASLLVHLVVALVTRYS
jgi:hypothetical protein